MTNVRQLFGHDRLRQPGSKNEGDFRQPYEEFQYTQDFGQAPRPILDLTARRDRMGEWTYRHYNGTGKGLDDRSRQSHHGVRVVHLRNADEHYGREGSDTTFIVISRDAFTRRSS